MATVKLGARPKSFKRLVKFPMLDGTEGSVECTFKYRTRKEFGVFIDGFLQAVSGKPAGRKKKGEATSDEPEKFSTAELMEKTAGANADYILQFLEGWNLEEELNSANVQQLADEIPAAAAEIMEAYRAAVVEGRLGN